MLLDVAARSFVNNEVCNFPFSGKQYLWRSYTVNIKKILI